MSIVRRIVSSQCVRALKNAGGEHPSVIADACGRLAAAGHHAIPTVVDLLDDDQARPHAIEILRSLVHDGTIDALVDALESASRAATGHITRILIESQRYQPGRLLPLLAERTRARQSIEYVLTERAADLSAGALVDAVIASPADARPSLWKLIELKADPSVVPELGRTVQHDDPQVRARAAAVLGNYPDAAPTQWIAPLLEDSNKTVRLAAVTALGRVAEPEMIPVLCHMLRDPDLKVHTAAIDALLAYGDVTAVPHLIEVLKDESEYARRGAVEVLNELATVEAIHDLVCALRDADWWVRVRAADALGALGGEKVVDAILGLLASHDVNERRYGVEILNSVPSDRSIDALVGALDDSDWWVRERSIDALGAIGNHRATQPLIDLMQRDPDLAVLCARALGALGDVMAIDALAAQIEGGPDELVREASAALEAMTRRDLASSAQPRIRAALKAARTSAASDSTGRPLSLARRSLLCGGRRGSSGVVPEVTERSVNRSRESGVGLSGATPTQPPASSPTPSSESVPPVAPTPEPAAAQTPPPAVQTPDSTSSSIPSPGFELNKTMDLAPDTVIIDRYRVVRRIGGGGFGSVYLVFDTAVDDTMVIKILNPQISQDESMITRFVRELKLTRKITHPNVIRLYDFLPLGGAHGISMEYFPAQDLGRLLEGGVIVPVRPGLRIVEQIARGLSAAHRLGILHRDIKPPNILVTQDGIVKIVDFGLASLAQQAGSMTKSGMLLGSPHYMAPEQVTGAAVDARCDIYALGAVMYEMFAGRRAVTGDNALKILFQHVEGEILPLGSVADISPAIETIVMRALAKVPDERYEGAAELAAAIRALPEFS